MCSSCPISKKNKTSEMRKNRGNYYAEYHTGSMNLKLEINAMKGYDVRNAKEERKRNNLIITGLPRMKILKIN